MKKLSLWLVVLSMLMTLLPGTMASAANEWFDVEVEAGTGSGGEQDMLTANAQVGDGERTYMYRIQGTNGHTTSTNTFTVSTAGEYDIWAVVGVKNANYLCSYKFDIDSTEVYKKGMENAYSNATGSALYTTVDVAGGNTLEAKWVRIASKQSLTATEHTLVAEIAAATAVANTFGAIDCVRFVPSSWNWTPDSSFDAPTEMTPTADENGVIHLEAENGVVVGYNTTNEEKASGGKYLSIKKKDNGFETHPSTTMNFKTTENGTYDVYAAIATGTQNYLGGMIFTLDGTEIFNENMCNFDRTNADLYGKDIDLHSGSAHYVNVRWVKIASEQAIESGTHSICNTLKKCVNENGIIDCVRLIPTGMSWEAKDFTTAPVPGTPGGDTGDDDDVNVAVPDENGIIDIEAEDGVLSGSMKVYELAAASKGKYTMSSSTTTLGSTVVSFKTIGENTYDIWAAVATPTGTGTHLGGYSFTLDDDDQAMYSKNHSGTDRTHPDLWDGNTVVLHTGDKTGSTSTVRWVKIASGKTIDAGDHTITAGVIAGTPANSTGAIDCIRLIPTGMEWDAAELPDVAFARKLAEEIKKTYFAGDYTAVTEDIELPKEIELPKNASVTYESDKPEVITADGSVTRPYFNTDDATVNFYVCAKFNDKTVKLPVEMKVLKNAKYTVTEFEASELTANDTFAAYACIDLNAAADSEISGKCAIVAALYNADGSLAAITMDGATVTPKGAELGVELQMPVDVSGCYVKVYVMNGLEMANQLAEVITVR